MYICITWSPLRLVAGPTEVQLHRHASSNACRCNRIHSLLLPVTYGDVHILCTRIHPHIAYVHICVQGHSMSRCKPDGACLCQDAFSRVRVRTHLHFYTAAAKDGHPQETDADGQEQPAMHHLPCRHVHTHNTQTQEHRHTMCWYMGTCTCGVLHTCTHMHTCTHAHMHTPGNSTCRIVRPLDTLASQIPATGVMLNTQPHCPPCMPSFTGPAAPAASDKACAVGPDSHPEPSHPTNRADSCWRPPATPRPSSRRSNTSRCCDSCVTLCMYKASDCWNRSRINQVFSMKRTSRARKIPRNAAIAAILWAPACVATLRSARKLHAKRTAIGVW